MVEVEPGRVAITGLSVLSAYGRGKQALLAGIHSGRSGFAPVTRFDVSGRRAKTAAVFAQARSLGEELTAAVTQACGEANLNDAQRRDAPLLLALHGQGRQTGSFADKLAAAAGLGAATAYTSACVAASTAVCDAASLLTQGRVDRVVVAAGYLVDAEQFALFDAGRALAVDGAVRPFSTGRKGLLLGDGVAAIVLESATRAQERGATPLAWIAGWGRSGDAYHVCQPRPDGSGLARAISAALRRGRIGADEVDYINAHGSGSAQSDAAEASAIRSALGAAAEQTPVSGTKSLHGQALEASPLLELAVTVLALQQGVLPINAGYLGPDDQCRLNLILDQPLRRPANWALSLNSAFGGANTALVVGAA